VAWIVRFEGQELNTDDLTLEELDAVATAAKSPWALMNPVADAKVAIGFIALCMVKAGLSDEESAKRAASLTPKDVKGAFTWIADGADLPTEWTDGKPDPKAAAARRTSGSSGRGRTSAGRRT
jgi:hypothetical protein